jgi:hypothetical protein
LSNKGITAKDVFKVAETLVREGQTPTQERIREYLGRGSRGTIHKYLKQWKENCFQQKGNSLKTDALDARALFEEKHFLEKVIENQIAQNALLASQLVESERELRQLQAGHQQLMLELAEIKEKYGPLEIKYQSLEEAYQVLKEGQGEALQTVMIDKNQQIESLRQELKEVNQSSLAAVMDLGYRGDDALMTEKVKTLHLRDKVAGLEKTVQALRQPLLDAERIKSSKNAFANPMADAKKVASEPLKSSGE